MDLTLQANSKQPTLGLRKRNILNGCLLGHQVSFRERLTRYGVPNLNEFHPPF